jgi:hypothetical protein
MHTTQQHTHHHDRHHTVLEGTIAGAIAATGVALWFFVGDVIAGAVPTPALLGSALANVLGAGAVAASPLAAALAYTVVHYAAFIALGVGAAALVHRARRDATVLAAALLGFVVAEFSFVGVLALLNALTSTGALTWPQLAVGNLVGCALLGAWLWRRHPALRGELDAALAGAG